jgi:hypothetical protein
VRNPQYIPATNIVPIVTRATAASRSHPTRATPIKQAAGNKDAVLKKIPGVKLFQSVMLLIR